MGLLRAAADAVLVGCGTVNASPKGRWRADSVFPDAAEASGRSAPEPARVAIATGLGRLKPEHPVLREGALVLATERAAGVLDGRLPEEAELAVVPGDTAVDVTAAVRFLRERGYGRILSEAGPRLFGSLVGRGTRRRAVPDRLAAARRPRARRGPARDRRGRALLPEQEHRGSLRSARLHGEHLFLRYGF